MLAILLALPLIVMNWSDAGIVIFASYIFTGLICLQTEWSRNIMIGLYIVGGFWYLAAGAM